MRDSIHQKFFSSSFLSGLIFTFAMLMPDIGNATIYYVAKTGSDTNPGTETSPFLTIKKGITVLIAGDTLYVKGGTYKESILSWQTTIPNGTSWGNPVTVAANPGENVIINPLPGTAFFWVKDGKAKYLIIDGFIIDGKGEALHGFKFTDNTRNIRVKNTEIKNTGHGVLITICSGCQDIDTAPMNTYHEFHNMKVHHNGTHFTDHGFYISTSFNLIENSEIFSNAGYGIHWFNASGNTVNNNISRFNKVYNNGTSGRWSCGILLSSGYDNEAYGNVVYGNLVGLCSGYRSINAKFYNNIAYENKLDGINITTGGNERTLVSHNSIYNNGIRGIFVIGDAKNARVENNIVYKNITADIFLEPGAQTETTVLHNLTTDPKFVSDLDKDFHLQEGSSAINSGKKNPEITHDFDGVERNIGAPDIGAYEFPAYTSDTTAPSAPIGLQIQ